MTPDPPALQDALDRVRRARTPADLFGEDAAGAARAYRRLARLVHPDATGNRTTDEFYRLNTLWRHRDAAITTRRRTYHLGAKRAGGDLADLYDASYGGRRAVVKLARDPADGDLLEREAVALRQLPKDGDGRFLPYVPRLVESFQHKDAGTGTVRRANVMAALDGFSTFAQVREAYPDGVEPRDAAWMWRRLLVALGFAHRAVVLHGGVLPEHVLIHPEEHGLVLVDWCYSVPGCLPANNGRVPAMVDRYADWYPPEVPAREQASGATDIYMATRCMLHLMGDKAPKPMRSFARGCLLPSQRRRPGDAWRLLEEFDELLERMYGPRRFRPFTMPGG